MLLAGADKDGLDPAYYDVPNLRAMAARLGDDKSRTADASTAFNAALDVSMRRFFEDLHAGRVDPRAVGFEIAPHPREDARGRLTAAVRAHRLTTAVAEQMPTIPLYRELRAALAHYRVLAADPDLASPHLPALTLHLGDRSGELPAVRRLLVAFGDLSGDPTAADPEVYDSALAIAVRRFQERHGLEIDGAIGKATRAALQVPLSWRVRQIELAMERLRWLPDREGQPLLAVNIPMFRVWAVDGPGPQFTTEVIVGRAMRTRTPVFADELELVIFRPYWNVPPSILRNEILPAIRRDPAYLQKHNMEYVGAGAGLRVRQRPGPSNSLGLIKFAFPNDDNVYMHGTPAPTLFSRPRRDFSHGCIRVADPVGLAEWVLAHEGGWPRDRIVAAINGSESIQVRLTRPIRVVLFYMTALVLPSDGRLHLADDIYGHDARLHRALEAICGSKTS